MNQHYISRVLLKRFRQAGKPLQCYQVRTGEWREKSVERACAESGYNQLLTSAGIDDTAEEQFSKVESHVPKLFRALEEAPDRSAIQLSSALFADLCRYCAFLFLSSIAAKASAVVNFVYQLNLDLEIGQRGLLQELEIPETTVASWQTEVLAGKRVIVEAENIIQLIYRYQLRRRFNDECGLFNHTKWTVCVSPTDLPMSDVGLIPVALTEAKANRYVLPISPRLALQGIFFHDVTRNAPCQPLRGLSLNDEEASELCDVICCSAVTEITCSSRIANISERICRAQRKGVNFLQVTVPQEIASAGIRPSPDKLYFRVVPMNEFVAFVHSFVKPRA